MRPPPLPPLPPQEIRKHFEHLNFVEATTQLYSVDSQHVHGGSVIVSVTGTLSSKGKTPRAFMQSFLLSAQEPRRYYVANDIFRYLPEPQLLSYMDAKTPEPTPAPTPAPVPDPPKPDPVPQPEQQPVPEEPPLPASNVPLTYAERLKLGKTGGAPAPTSAPAPVPTPAPVPAPAPARREPPRAEQAPPTERPSAPGVVVKDLPSSADEAMLREALGAYGTIKSVSLKHVKGKSSYAFVDFTDAAAVKAALAASVEVDGRAVVVDEKRPKAGGMGRGGRGGRGAGYGGRGT